MCVCVCVCVHYTPAGFQQMGCVPVFICVCVHVCVFCMCVHVCDKVCTRVVCVFDVPYGVCNKRNGGSSVPLVNTHTHKYKMNLMKETTACITSGPFQTSNKLSLTYVKATTV